MPVWLVIFPEGTRFDRSKLARSDRYAEMAGISKLDHVLAPHTTGFEVTNERLTLHIHCM
jgi:1-acyl-sn-glycerol-3-phosphate acyltransferase